MIYTPALTPKADWLSLSFSDADFLPTHLSRFLNEHFECQDADKGVYHASGVGNYGTIKFAHARQRYGMSASGGALDYIRSSGLEPEFLDILTDSPHKVTRLDLALDRPCDMANLMPRLLRDHSSGLRLRPKGKLVRPVRFDELRADGERSGSVYYGERADALSLRVYDKTLERFKKAGLELPDQYTRYEFTYGRDYKGVTLADYCDPAPLFWHHAQVFLRVPNGISDWVPREVVTPKYSVSTRTPYERLESRARFSAIEGLFECADSLGLDRSEVLKILQKLYLV